MGISARKLLAVLTLLGLGCAHQAVQAPAKDAYDAAYLGLRAQQDGCGPHAVVCCEGLKAKLDQAVSSDRMADLAEILDAMAISCPTFRAPAIAALNHQPKRAASADDGVISVSYVLDIGPGDRVYWISDFVDAQLASRTPVSAGTHQVDVEVHVMTTGQTGRDHLYRVRGSAEVVVEAKRGAALTAVLKRLPGDRAQVPFALLLTDKWRGTRTAAAAATPAPPSSDPAATPVIVPAQRLDFGKPRYPSELSGAGEIAVLSKVCMTAAGKVDSVTPLFTPHPRYTAVLVAGMFESKYRPYTVNGRAVPSCQPVKLTID